MFESPLPVGAGLRPNHFGRLSDDVTQSGLARSPGRPVSTSLVSFLLSTHSGRERWCHTSPGDPHAVRGGRSIYVQGKAPLLERFHPAGQRTKFRTEYGQSYIRTDRCYQLDSRARAAQAAKGLECKLWVLDSVLGMHTASSVVRPNVYVRRLRNWVLDMV